MNEYQRLVSLMRKSDNLEEFHIYAVLLAKWLKENS